MFPYLSADARCRFSQPGYCYLSPPTDSAAEPRATGNRYRTRCLQSPAQPRGLFPCCLSQACLLPSLCTQSACHPSTAASKELQNTHAPANLNTKPLPEKHSRLVFWPSLLLPLTSFSPHPTATILFSLPLHQLSQTRATDPENFPHQLLAAAALVLSLPPPTPHLYPPKASRHTESSSPGAPDLNHGGRRNHQVRIISPLLSPRCSSSVIVLVIVYRGASLVAP